MTPTATDPTSPSEPVESREQPRVGQYSSSFRPQQWWRDLLAERDAAIRNLETLRDVHRRTIDDLISEAQTAGATIDELRAGYESRKLTGEVWETCARGMDERLAAALAEVSRLREQGEALAQQVTDLEREVYELSMGEDL